LHVSKNVLEDKKALSGMNFAAGFNDDSHGRVRRLKKKFDQKTWREEPAIFLSLRWYFREHASGEG
jgi:hypothetical protein